MLAKGILDRRITETPIAIVDFETTGLSPGADRIVEACVIRMNPGHKPKVVFESLINPCRPMAATDIHGITDADVTHAPAFTDVARIFVDAIADCLVAAYNVYFDMRFLEYEFTAAGIKQLPPYLCLMYMRPMLGLGRRCSLAEACMEHGIHPDQVHTARADCDAAARLLQYYMEIISFKGIETYEHLRDLRYYKFLDSFRRNPLSALGCALGDWSRLAPRTSKEHHSIAPAERRDPTSRAMPTLDKEALRLYWDSLKTVLADLHVTDDEARYLRETIKELNLPKEQVRILHARAFVNVLSGFAADRWLDDKECQTLHKLHRCLSKAGWAPGDAP